MPMMDCIKCKAAIEDDAHYCDQCGGEIFRCTAADCRKPGGPKRCMHCGKPMASARSLGEQPAAGVAARSANAIGKLRLQSAAQGIDIEPADGDVLGRVHGQHATTLSRFSQISSSHLQVRRQSDGSWRITDMKSFNGTFYNGSRLVENQEVQPLDGGVLRLGDIDLQVSIR